MTTTNPSKPITHGYGSGVFEGLVRVWLFRPMGYPRPTLPSAETKAEKKPKVANNLNQTWPADTHITLQPDGKMSVKAQKPVIRAVCHLAFIHLYAKLLFENAFPSASERVQFSCDALYSAAKERSDVNYTDVMGKLVSVANDTCSSFQWLHLGRGTH